MEVYLFSTLGVILAALISGYFAWKVANRQSSSTDRVSSGGIETSVAADLWDEGNSMRTELRGTVTDLKSQLATSNDQLAALIPQITELNLEISQARQATEAAREETRKSRAETKVLSKQISELHLETVAVHNEIRTGNGKTIVQSGQDPKYDDFQYCQPIPQ